MKKACLNLILIFINAILSGVFSERPFGVFFVASILMIVVAAEAVRDETGPGAFTAVKLLLITSAAAVSGNWIGFLFFFCLDELPLILLPVLSGASFAAFCLGQGLTERKDGNLSGHSLAITLLEGVLIMLIVTGISGLKRMIEKEEIIKREERLRLLSVSVSEMHVRKLNKELKMRSYEAEKNARLLERENISRNIHNSVGHSITAAIMTLDAADMLYDKKPEEARKRMNDANERIRGSLESIRSAVRALDDEGGETTVQDFLRFVDNIIEAFTMDTELEVNLHCEIYPEDGTLPREHAEFLTGVLEELLTNGVKHGNATRFTVHLTGDSAHIRLLVHDNGTGEFTGKVSDERIQNGFGLKKIISYTERCGGSCSFVYENGFCAEVELPVA